MSRPAWFALVKIDNAYKNSKSRSNDEKWRWKAITIWVYSSFADIKIWNIKRRIIWKFRTIVIFDRSKGVCFKKQRQQATFLHYKKTWYFLDYCFPKQQTKRNNGSWKNNNILKVDHLQGEAHDRICLEREPC